MTIFLIFVIGFNSSGQERKYFSENNPSKNGDFVILKTDTLYAIESNYKKILFESERDGNDYLKAVFHYKNAKHLRQWKSEIKVYLSRKLDKKLRKKFKDYVNSFPQLDNFKVSVVKHLEHANYYIKGTRDFKSIFEGKEYTEKTIRKSLYNNLNYKIKRDGDGFKSCVLTFHPDKIDDQESFLRRLKKVFFITTGQFQQNYWLKTKSLLNRKMDSIDDLTDFDRRLLRYHYEQLYQSSINVQTFIEKYADYKK